jgi:hypothetical protein
MSKPGLWCSAALSQACVTVFGWASSGPLPAGVMCLPHAQQRAGKLYVRTGVVAGSHMAVGLTEGRRVVCLQLLGAEAIARSWWVYS